MENIFELLSERIVFEQEARNKEIEKKNLNKEKKEK